MELFAAAPLVELCVCARVYGAMEIVENTKVAGVAAPRPALLYALTPSRTFGHKDD